MNLKKNLAKILFILFAVAFLIAEYSRIGDFNIFLLASQALADGENIYAINYVSGFNYYYSPLFAILIYPLTLIPKELAGFLWNAAGFVMLARIFVLMHKMFVPHLKENLGKISILVFLATLFPIYSNFHMTQLSVVMLYAILESINLIVYKKRSILGAAILALAINIKILPIVIIPYLVYRKQYKATLLIVLFTGFYLILPSVFIGTESNMELHAGWFETIDPTKDANVIDLNERGLHSITSLVSSLLTDFKNPFELTVRRNILNVDESVISLVINLIRLALILFTIYFLRTKPFQKAQSSLHRFWEISYLCLLIPLIFPHQQLYGFLLVLPATYYLVYYLINIKSAFDKKWMINLVIGLAITSILIINLELILGLYRKYFWHYKTLTYGAILMLIVLAICKPTRLTIEGADKEVSNS